MAKKYGHWIGDVESTWGRGYSLCALAAFELFEAALERPNHLLTHGGHTLCPSPEHKTQFQYWNVVLKDRSTCSRRTALAAQNTEWRILRFAELGTVLRSAPPPAENNEDTQNYLSVVSTALCVAALSSITCEGEGRKG